MQDVRTSAKAHGARLDQLETEIQDAQSAHEETIRESTRDLHLRLGRLLGEIRRGKLWQSGYPSWDAYCTQRWGWTRQWCNRLIKAASSEENGALDKPEQGQDGKPLSIDEMARSREQALDYKRLNSALGRVENRLDTLRDKAKELWPQLGEPERSTVLGHVRRLVQWGSELETNLSGDQQRAA